MSGCLKGVLKFIVAVVLVALVAAGWHWRHEFRAMWQFWRGGEEEIVTTSGLASPAALASARDKVDSLNGWREDSVRLSAPEFAALLADGFGASLKGHLDSVAVTLGAGRFDLVGRLETRVIPRAALGPLASLIHPREWIRLGGTLEVLGAGRAEWKVDGVRMRGVRLPKGMVPRLVEASFGGSASGGVPITIPAGVTNVRVTPGAVILGGTPRGR